MKFLDFSQRKKFETKIFKKFLKIFSYPEKYSKSMKKSQTQSGSQDTIPALVAFSPLIIHTHSLHLPSI